MEALAANLLELLAWLGKQGVAMRDLKPDNLLVAGNPDAYPLFLASADDFTLGLIDVETACDFGSPDAGAFVQPQLGGPRSTPPPLIFFPTGSLPKVHGDLGKVLHYQDWHAVAAIIFEMATGKRLFGRTAGQVPRIMGALQKAVTEHRSLVDLYRAVNGVFWQQAAEEFARVTAIHGQRLEVLRVRMPRFFMSVAAAAMDRAQQCVDHRFDACLGRRSEGLSATDRQKLKACSAAQLQRLKEKYRTSGTDDHQRIAAWCDDLAALKQEAEALAAAMNPLPEASGVVSARKLLTLMHYATAGVMATGGPVSLEPSPLEEISDVPPDQSLPYDHRTGALTTRPFPRLAFGGAVRAYRRCRLFLSLNPSAFGHFGSLFARYFSSTMQAKWVVTFRRVAVTGGVLGRTAQRRGTICRFSRMWKVG